MTQRPFSVPRHYWGSIEKSVQGDCANSLASWATINTNSLQFGQKTQNKQTKKDDGSARKLKARDSTFPGPSAMALSDSSDFTEESSSDDYPVEEETETAGFSCSLM